MMIDTCDQSVASWYDDGLTFVVKDTEKFASEIIPEFFKVRIGLIFRTKCLVRRHATLLTLQTVFTAQQLQQLRPPA